jgi:hypothetical protein
MRANAPSMPEPRGPPATVRGGMGRLHRNSLRQASRAITRLLDHAWRPARLRASQLNIPLRSRPRRTRAASRLASPSEGAHRPGRSACKASVVSGTSPSSTRHVHRPQTGTSAGVATAMRREPLEGSEPTALPCLWAHRCGRRVRLSRPPGRATGPREFFSRGRLTRDGGRQVRARSPRQG